MKNQPDDLFVHSLASEQWAKVGVKLKQEARAVVLPGGLIQQLAWYIYTNTVRIEVAQ